MTVHKLCEYRSRRGKDALLRTTTSKRLPDAELAPLCINIPLAQRIGIKESVMLTMLDDLVEHYGNEAEGHRWIRMSHEEWSYELGALWSVQTVARALTELKALGILIAKNLNANRHDKTLSYRIDYDHQLLREEG